MNDRLPAKQSLGQNFLVDANLARKMVAALKAAPGEPVLEIGPGTGALTRFLLEVCETLTAVEIDQRLVPGLREQFGDRLELIHADILNVDLTTLSETKGARLVVLGNLPYYASSPILFHLIKHRAAIDRAVVTLQQEVVERCAAKPGTKVYGSLTVQIALAAQVKKLFTLSPHAFRPRPKVASAVMLLDFTRPAPLAPKSAAMLEKVLRAAFGQRRKQIHNSLAAAFGTETAARMLAAAGIDPRARAETLSPETFVHLADLFFEQR